jgi:hypothetical protein
MKKWIFLSLLLLAALPGFAQTTTYTGTIKDLTGATVTSGRVTFTLMPGIDTTISGTARFTPMTVSCTINGSGQVVSNVSGACVVTSNTALTPSGTYYQIAIQPYFVTPGSIVNAFAIGGSVDITTLVPTPATSPQFGQGIPGPTGATGPPGCTIGYTCTGAALLAGATFTGPFDGPEMGNLFTVGPDGYSTIAAAISAAGTTGTIYIRSDYAGTDAISNPNNLQIIDARKLGDLDFHVWTGISPAYPVANYPGGNDMRVETRGPADLYFAQTPYSTSTTTSLVVGLNTNIAVGSTANFTTSSYGGLRVGRGTANDEIVSNYTVVDATHITMTCALTHSGTTPIEQIGETFLDMAQIGVAANNPPGLSGHNQPIYLYDVNRNITLLVPISLSDPWPYSGLGIGAQIHGESTNGDLIFRAKLSGSTTHFESSGGADLFTINEGTGLVANQLPATGYRITPKTDAEAAYFYGTNAADSANTWHFDTLGGFTDNVFVATPQLNQVTAGSWAKALVFASASTGTFTFPTAYANTPVCTVTPRTSLGATTYSYVPSTTGVAVTTSTAVSDTFDIICAGNPN